MNKRALLYLALTTTLLVVLLYGIAIDAPLPQGTKNRLDYNQILGSEVEHAGLPFTLNFEQQNALITYLNEAQLNMETHLESLPYSKLIFYRFNDSNIVITPLAYIGGNLLFSSPIWNNGHPLLEKSNGALKELLENTYDKVD